MTKRLIPERTIDSLFAYEALTALPSAIIWSPTIRTKGIWDHAILTSTRWALIVECKAVQSNEHRDPAEPWTVPINIGQLDNYLTDGLDLTYLLPSRPALEETPWVRICRDDPIPGDRTCSACAGPAALVHRRGAGANPVVKGAPFHVRLQPWFNHWAWCVSASDLDTHLRTLGHPSQISAHDDDLAAIRGADRLCHVLSQCHDLAIEEPSVATRPSPFVLSAGVALELIDSFADEHAQSAGPDEEATPPVAVTF